MPATRTRSVQGPGSNSRSSGSGPKNALLKVVILGDGGVGKTCLISRFVSDKFDPCSFHTIGVEFLNKDVELDSASYTLQIWDTAGQERFKSLRTPFYRGTDICILTYSVDDRNSFVNLAAWKREFLYYAGIDEEAGFPFVVVGNKVDVDVETRRVTTDEAVEWCLVNGRLSYVETSAKDSTNVGRAFETAVESWILMEERLDKPFLGETVKLGPKGTREATEKTSCCGFL